MKKQRLGFTLVELLVVITIIGILMGLLIPAINAAREAARRNQCSTQLKNLALAAIQHENSKGELPGYIQSFGFYEPPGAAPFDPSDPTATAAPPRHIKLGTWVVSLLPWLEAQPTYEHWTEDRYPILDGTGGDYDATGTVTGAGAGVGGGFHALAAPNLAIMQCPSNPNELSDSGLNSYISNNGARSLGSAPPATSTDPAYISYADSMERPNGAFNNKYAAIVSAGPPAVLATLGPKVRLDDFKDGQGNTILFSENVQAMPWHLAGFISSTDLNPGSAPAADVAFQPEARYAQGMVWHYEDPDNTATIAWSNGLPTAVNQKHLINGGGNTVSEDIFVETMTAATSDDLARPSSAHVDGVNAGMADGGTRFITEEIDYRVYQALMTLRGKSSDVPWPEFVLNDDAF